MGWKCQALVRSQALSSHSHMEDKLQYKGSISHNLCGIGKPVFWKSLPLFSFWRNFLSLISITCRIWLRRVRASAVQFSLELSSATLCYKTLIRLEITQTHGGGAVTGFKLWSTRLTTEKHWWEELRWKTWTNFHGKVGLLLMSWYEGLSNAQPPTSFMKCFWLHLEKLVRISSYWSWK